MRKKLSLITNTFLLTAVALFLCGCGSLLTYGGADFDKEKVKLAETKEGFIFSTYSKTSTVVPIALRVGISKSTMAEVLVGYFEFKNLSNENQVFYLKDLQAFAGGKSLGMVRASDYINAYQGEQTGMIASMQSMAPTIRNIATISNPYNQTQGAVDEYAVAYGSSNDIARVVKGIAEHSLTSAAILKPENTVYYYIFFENTDTYPITFKYQDLEYTFATGAAK